MGVTAARKIWKGIHKDNGYPPDRIKEIDPEFGRKKALRINLHNAISNRVRAFGFLSLDTIVEKIKRCFLWYEMGVETSKALSVNELIIAIEKARSYQMAVCASHLEKKYGSFSVKDYAIVTHNQRNKLVKVLKYIQGLNDDEIKTYVFNTIGRRDWVGFLTINEADKVIKRAEKWEKKTLTGKE